MLIVVCVYILVYVVNNVWIFDFCLFIYLVNFLIGEFEYRYYFYKNDVKFIYFINMKILYVYMIYINWWEGFMFCIIIFGFDGL